MTIATTEDYTQAVAAEVRAMTARKSVPHKEIADALAVSPMYVSRRMAGHNAWTAGELYAIADVLCCDVRDLLPEGMPVTGGLGVPVTPFGNWLPILAA